MRVAYLPKRAYRWGCVSGVLVSAISLFAQVDPGPRGGPAGAGGTFAALDSNASRDAAYKASFATALQVFKEVDSVSGALEPGTGLGPTFNGNSCAMCHLQPAAGGSSPGLTSKQNSVANPQVALATLHGAHNTVPSFITANGPVREARFVSTNPGDPGAPLDGGVHGLYTIAGRSDAPGCALPQNDFATPLAQGNVIFRIPTPTFGLGLVENTSDQTLQQNLASTSAQRSALNIGGRFNSTGNDGTLTRFGWKAQNKSLVVFSGEAYNVEQGVSNEVFANERFPGGTSASVMAGCTYNATPEDHTDVTGLSGDVISFATAMRLLAPPTPTTSSKSELNGQQLFNQVGCNLCHSTSLTTGKSNYPALSNMTYHPYSDFAIHHVGSNLSDGVNQGAAGPDEFRTAPLWGLGQRLFFLHDGRTADLLAAIAAHSSPGNQCTATQSLETFTVNGGSLFRPLTATLNCGSEANNVVSNFNNLNQSQKQDLLNFLRSL
ncbi:MAG TPA: di-heme oxidoredictase family protein [Bryobacteraceae bacterium]